MDQREFDALTRALTTGRRGVVRGLLGALGAALGLSLPSAAEPRRDKGDHDRRAPGAGGRGRGKHQGRVVAQLGGDDQPPYCTPGGQYCDVDEECCNGLCCGNECCIKGPNVVCCPNAQGKQRCTNLKTSSGHCGACGNACQPGMHCDDGQCAGKPADPDDICESDRDCGEGATCCGHVCCEPPLGTCCHGECAFPDGGDHRHCGACGKACGPGELCCFNFGGLGPDWECRRQDECCQKQTLDTGKRHVPCGKAPHGTCCPADGATCCGDICVDSKAGQLCCDDRPIEPGDHQHCGSCDAACGPKDVCCTLTESTGLQKHVCASLESCCQERSAIEQKKLFACGGGPDGTCCRLGAEDCVDGECRPAKGQGDDPGDGPKGAAPPQPPRRRQRRATKRRR